MIAWKWLNRVFESKDEKLIREVVETNPEVKKFADSHPGYSVKRDRKFPSKSMLKSLKEYQKLMNYAGVEELQPKARAAYREEMRALLRSGGHPEILADLKFPENVVLFNVGGSPEFVESKTGKWVYNFENVYKQDVLHVYMDPVKREIAGVRLGMDTYSKHENVLPTKQLLKTR